MRALRLTSIVFGSLMIAGVAWGEAAPPFLTKWGSAGSGNGQFNFPQDIATDAAGNVYVVDVNNNRVQKFTGAGVYVTQWGGLGSGNGQFNSPRGVAIDAAGSVYVTDYINNRIQKFTGAGAYITQWGSGGTGDGQFSGPIDVATDAAGSVYVADYSNRRIQKFTSTGTYLTKWGSFGGGDGQFVGPWGVETDVAGNVYVSDVTGNRIQKFNSTGTFLTKWGSSGTGDGQFSGLYGLTTDAAGNVYAADNNRVQKFSGTGTFLAKWGSTGAGDGQFSGVVALAADLSGNLYVVDQGNRRVQKFGPLITPPTFLMKWGTSGSGPGQFLFPQDVATDPAGNVYVADAVNNRIQKFTNDGTYITQWGTPGSGNGQFNNPYGLTFASGNVYVADASNSRIQKFTSAGGFVMKWGSSGSLNGQFNGPQDVATDAAGNVYVADYGNNRIQVFSSSGVWMRQWGTSGTGNGQFNGPWGLVTDAAGNVYVSDFSNNRIQKFNNGGAYITQWGGVGSGDGQVSGPEGLAIDAAGNIYVADYYNYRIDKFNSVGTYLTKWNYADAPFNNYVTGVATDASGNVFVVNYNHEVDKYGPLGISRIQPGKGGDGGPATVVIEGAGFQGGATAKLGHSGQSDIAGTQVAVAADGRSLTATFDLSGKLQDLWNVVVTNPDLSAATLTNGFKIELSAPHQLRLDVIGRSSMRPDRRRAFDIVLENLGNSDVFSVPLWIARIPTSATVELDFPLTPAPQSGGEPDWSLAPLTFTGPGGKYLALVIPRLPPGVTTRRLYLTVPNSVTSFQLNAALTPPWADGNVFRSCLSGAGVITAPACMGAQLTSINTYLATTPGVQALSGIGLWAKIAWQCEGAASLPAALVKAEQVLDYMLQPIEGAAVPAGCAVSLAPQWQDSLVVRVVTSVDPNEKLGAGGVGPNRQIGSQQLLPYSIQFENQQTATAPAQEVVVIDALDASKYDLNTVSLGQIKFGKRANGLPWTIEPPPGLSSYTTTVDLRPELNLLVRVGFNLDRASGSTAWSMTSIDPATGLSPVDDQVGFLPPNLTPPQGEGSVALTVLPKAGLANGALISNQSSIVFDGVSLGTAPWTNTIDTGAPQSNVLPLGGTQDSASFTVHWALTGSFPDFRDHSVYVSQNGGAYRPWRLHTRATADTIGAPGGGNYAFYSLARDSSGNLEAVPGAPDVQTFSRVSVDETGRLEFALEGAQPNPVTGPARVWFTLPSREQATLEVMDVAGRRLLRREVGPLGPGRHFVDLSAAVRRPGLYFLRLAQGGRTLRARMAVVR